jgi:hypothetical protein
MTPSSSGMVRVSFVRWESSKPCPHHEPPNPPHKKQKIPRSLPRYFFSPVPSDPTLNPTPLGLYVKHLVYLGQLGIIPDIFGVPS